MMAPLMAGNDLTTMTAGTISILCNKDAIAVDQDSLAEQGKRISTTGTTGIDIYVKKMKNQATRAVLLCNRGTAAVNISIQWTANIINWKATDKVTIFNIWTKTTISGVTNGYTATAVPKHGSVFLLLTNETMISGINGSTEQRNAAFWQNAVVSETPDAVHFSLPQPPDAYMMRLVTMTGRIFSVQHVCGNEYSISKKTIPAGVFVVQATGNNGIVYSKQIVCTR
jgi:hypothetical protein